VPGTLSASGRCSGQAPAVLGGVAAFALRRVRRNGGRGTLCFTWNLASRAVEERGCVLAAPNWEASRGLEVHWRGRFLSLRLPESISILASARRVANDEDQ
jgi:hypothetical protein